MPGVKASTGCLSFSRRSGRISCRLVLRSSLFAGFGMARAGTKSPLHVYGFAITMALSVYLILDIEYPRLGFITIESFDRAMIDLRATMG